MKYTLLINQLACVENNVEADGLSLDHLVFLDVVRGLHDADAIEKRAQGTDIYYRVNAGLMIQQAPVLFFSHKDKKRRFQRLMRKLVDTGYLVKDKTNKDNRKTFVRRTVKARKLYNKPTPTKLAQYPDKIGAVTPTDLAHDKYIKNNSIKDTGKDRPLRDIFPQWHERTTGVSISFSINDYSHCDRLEDQLQAHAEKHGRTLQETVDAYLATFYTLHQQKYWCCDTLTIRNVSKHYAEIMPKVKFMSDQEAKVLSVHKTKFEKQTGEAFLYGAEYLNIIPLMKKLTHRVPSSRLLNIVQQNNGDASALQKQLKAI